MRATDGWIDGWMMQATKTPDRAALQFIGPKLLSEYTYDLYIRLTLLISVRVTLMVLDKCNNYSCPLTVYPRNRAGSLNRKLLCSEPSLETGNGLYRPSHLFYFLENDEGPSSIPPSHQTSLHWNHHSTRIRGIIWLQLCSTVIAGLCRTN